MKCSEMTGNCTAQNEAQRFQQHYCNATAKAGTSKHFSFDLRTKGGSEACRGKVPQRVNAQIGHRPREHRAHSNPTCALRAPFVSHTFDPWFHLCRAKKVSTHTPNRRTGDNPSVLTKRTTQSQCIHVS